MITSTFGKQILQALGGMSQQVYLTIGYYMGLSSTTPNIDGTGYTEPTDPNYHRIKYYSATQSSDLQFPFEFVSGSGDKAITNKFEVHFDVATENWPNQMTHILLFSSSGGLLAYAPLTSPITVNTGYIPTILKGEAVISIDSAQ